MSEIPWVALSELRQNPRNPRRIGSEQLAQLMNMLEADRQHLEARPLICREDGTILSGNMRYAAARALGWDSLPALHVSVSDAEADAIALRENVHYGEWEREGLRELLAWMQDAGIDLALSGFSKDDLDRWLAGVSGGDDADDPDVVPDLPIEARSLPGESYPLGDHLLICGDATDADVWTQLLGEERANAIWTDPPYGVAYRSKGRKSADPLTNDDLDEQGTRELVVSAMLSAGSYMRQGAAFFVASSSGPMETVFREALAEAGLPVAQEVTWVKDQFVLGRGDYHVRHESLLYGHLGRPRRIVEAAAGTAWEIPRPRRSELHPTTKPVELVMRSLKTVGGHKGDVVVDCFAGSGTTLIACELMGMKARCVEIDPRYCDVIRDRYATLRQELTT